MSKKNEVSTLPPIANRSDGPEVEIDEDGDAHGYPECPCVVNLPLVHLYSRRSKRPVRDADKPPLLDMLIARAEAASRLPRKTESRDEIFSGAEGQGQNEPQTNLSLSFRT